MICCSDTLIFPNWPLHVDLVLPDLLLSSSRVVANSQKSAHLLDTGEQDLSSHEESNAFGTRRGGETSCLSGTFKLLLTSVSPEFGEVVDLGHRMHRVDAGLNSGVVISVRDHLGERREEVGWVISWVDPESKYGSGFALRCNMDKVHLRLGSSSLHRVVSRSVDMPP